MLETEAEMVIAGNDDVNGKRSSTFYGNKRRVSKTNVDFHIAACSNTNSSPGSSNQCYVERKCYPKRTRVDTESAHLESGDDTQDDRTTIENDERPSVDKDITITSIDDEIAEDSDGNDSKDLPSFKNKQSKTKTATKCQRPTRKWKDMDIDEENLLKTAYEALKPEDLPDWLTSEEWTPIKIFQLLCGNNYERIRKETERYGKRYAADFRMSIEETKCFIGVLLVSGYNKVPKRSMYWEEMDDVKNQLISMNTRRNTFDKIMRYIHVADSENLPQGRKISRVWDYFLELKTNFKKYNLFVSEMDVDECMVEYFGKYGAFIKQSIRMKPIRCGYKIWCLNSPLGYLVDFKVYEGASGRVTDNVHTFGLGAGVFLDLVDRGVPKNDDGEIKTFLLAIDNFFTSFGLIAQCSIRKIPVVGTIRSDHLKGAPIPPKKEMEKKNRGVISASFNEDLCVLSWKDNGVVNIASNAYGVNPIQKVSRWNRSTKQVVQVDMPYAAHKYNKVMGGTDRQDQNVNRSRTSIHSKKWWWALFTWGLDVTVQNTWLIYKSTNPDMKLVAFRRSVARELLLLNGSKPYGGQRVKNKLRNSSNSGELRFSQLPHLVSNLEQAQRCRVCYSKTN